MEKLKLKATAEAAAILLGFFVFGTLISFLFDEVTAELFRLVILEWGAFPMLCAITGGGCFRQKRIYAALRNPFRSDCSSVYVPFF
ncbi:MAG: hypothetical protein IJO22_08260 [Oscillospiraceae bacterium]|nr:hypothetical protein [Oscillospiraceae bacterium]